MFGHPVSIVGYVALVLGALMALMSFGEEFAQSAGFLLLGGGLEQIGAFLVLLGVIARGFERLEAQIAGRPLTAKGPAATRPKPTQRNNKVDEAAPIEVDGAELLRRQMLERGFRT